MRNQLLQRRQDAADHRLYALLHFFKPGEHWVHIYLICSQHLQNDRQLQNYTHKGDS